MPVHTIAVTFHAPDDFPAADAARLLADELGRAYQADDPERATDGYVGPFAEQITATTETPDPAEIVAQRVADALAGPIMPIVRTWPASSDGFHAVSINRHRGNVDATTVTREDSPALADAVASFLRGALADAYHAGRADAVDVVRRKADSVLAQAMRQDREAADAAGRGDYRGAVDIAGYRDSNRNAARVLDLLVAEISGTTLA